MSPIKADTFDSEDQVEKTEKRQRTEEPPIDDIRILSPLKHFSKQSSSVMQNIAPAIGKGGSNHPLKMMKRAASFASLDGNSITLSQEAEKAIESEVQIKSED